MSRETRPNKSKTSKKMKKYPKKSQYVEGNTSQQIKTNTKNAESISPGVSLNKACQQFIHYPKKITFIY